MMRREKGAAGCSEKSESRRGVVVDVVFGRM